MKILGRGEMVAAPTIIGFAALSSVPEIIPLHTEDVFRDFNLRFLLRLAQTIVGYGFDLESIGYSVTLLRIPLLRLRNGNEVLAVSVEDPIDNPTSICLRLGSLVPASDQQAWERTQDLQKRLKEAVDSAFSELGLDKLKWT